MTKAATQDLWQKLDQDWRCNACSLTGLIALQGTDGTPLVQRWLEALPHSKLPQPDGVFQWDFHRDRDVDRFLAALLLFLEPGINLQQYASSSAKVAYLQTGLHRSRQRFLLVLHGVEVWQHLEGDDYGLFSHAVLKGWLRDFAGAKHSSFCLLTTRAALLDLIDFNTYTHREVS